MATYPGDPRTAGDLIAAVRAHLGMSQAAFGAMTDRSPETIRRYEQGLYRPPAIFFHDLIEAAPEAGLRFNDIASLLGYRRVESIDPLRFGSIHEYVVGVRVHTGRSRTAFAAILGVSPDLIAAIEHHVKPDPELVLRMVGRLVEPEFRYADVVRRFRTLRPSRVDRDLRKRFRQLRDPITGEQHARHLRDELVHDNAERARQLAKREVRRMIAPLDADDVWPIALLKAVDGHDPRYGDFIPYLRRWIFGQARTQAAAGWQTGTAGVLRVRGSAVCQARDHLRLRLHREPTPAEVAAHLQLSTTTVNDVLGALAARHPASLDDNPSLHRSGNAASAYPSQATLSAEVRQWLSLLDENSRTLLLLHFEQDLDTPAIAEHLGVDRSAVEAAMTHAMLELRKLVTAQSRQSGDRPAPAATAVPARPAPRRRSGAPTSS